jgi:hypothetical protein
MFLMLAHSTSPTLTPITNESASGVWEGLTVDDYGFVQLIQLSFDERTLIACDIRAINGGVARCAGWKVVYFNVSEDVLSLQADSAGVAEQGWEHAFLALSGTADPGWGRLEGEIMFGTIAPGAAMERWRVELYQYTEPLLARVRVALDRAERLRQRMARRR